MYILKNAKGYRITFLKYSTDLYKIIHGVDGKHWSPKTDDEARNLWTKYTVDKGFRRIA